MHVRVGSHKRLHVLAVHAPEYDCRAGGRFERARGGDSPGLAFGPDSSQMGLAVRATAVEHVLDVLVEEQVMDLVRGHRPVPYRVWRYAWAEMSNLDRRRGYTPRRQREQRAYRLPLVGGGAAAVGVVSLVFAIVGVISLTLPVLALIVAAICFFLFQRATGAR